MTERTPHYGRHTHGLLLEGQRTPVPALTFNAPIKINSSLKLRYALRALRCATTARRQTAVAASRGQGSPLTWPHGHPHLSASRPNLRKAPGKMWDLKGLILCEPWRWLSHCGRMRRSAGDWGCVVVRDRLCSRGYARSRSYVLCEVRGHVSGKSRRGR